MELAVDEFIIDWHLSDDDLKKQTAESIVRLVKKKCHRIVFDIEYLNKFREKLCKIKRTREKDTYVLQVLIKRIFILMTDNAKVRICEGPWINELESINDEVDRLVVRSALSIQNEKKILITTDSELIGKLEALKKYGIEGVLPENAENLLLSL
ncbi:MAG: hypothetical protein QXW80_03940 [Candidatus Micrarchaeia archaeon]